MILALGGRHAHRAGAPPTAAREHVGFERQAILRIPVDDRSNVPFASGVIVTTTLYTQRVGQYERMIWAGGAGCAYGQANSCLRHGSKRFLRTGMIIDQMIDDLGRDDDLGEPMLLPKTGRVTFTRFVPGEVFFTTAAGGSGSYSLITRTVKFR
jgi:hypothetical protein